MLDAALHSARNFGAEVIWLCVWENNPRAQAFYKKAGFEVVGDIIIPMNGVPFRGLVMRMELEMESAETG